MALQVRRVVTGHDAEGRAIVQIDEMSQNLRSARPGATACVVWTSEGFPVDNTGAEDEGLRQTGTTHENGTVFRILELQPGNTPRVHRTDSLDYAVIMQGEIDMELETGEITHLKAGDVGPAGNRAQLDQPRPRALRHRLRADRGEAGGGWRQGAQGVRVRLT